MSKFSPNGQFLAYSSNSDYNIQIATVPDLKVINTLRGHTNFVYDLDWLVDKRKNSFPLHLVSASSDRTAFVWTIEKDRISLTVSYVGANCVCYHTHKHIKADRKGFLFIKINVSICNHRFFHIPRFYMLLSF